MIEDESAPYDMSIHSNSSALAWTTFFREHNPECNLDDNVMLGWFANAMMAMHDHIYQSTQPEQTEQEIETLVRDFFENYLDTWEESDSGREFHPITISCCRSMKVEPLDKLLTRMRELSGAKPPYEIGSSM